MKKWRDSSTVNGSQLCKRTERLLVVTIDQLVSVWHEACGSLYQPCRPAV